MLRLGAGSAGMFALGSSGLSVVPTFAGGNGGVGGGGSVYLEAFPTSPVILYPFKEELTIPKALRPMGDGDIKALDYDPYDKDMQDCFSAHNGPVTSGPYWDNYQQHLGCHQLMPGEGVTANYPWIDKKPLVYQIKVEVASHNFTKSQVQPIDSFGRAVTPPKSRNGGPQSLPSSTIYGFNGTFPGPRINAAYGRASCVRFENHLDVNPNNLDRQDFGTPGPDYTFLTHLHNGHTAPESDGQPHYSHYRFQSVDKNRTEHLAAFAPGEWVNQMYLGYPAGGDEREKQSFFWFHDHVHGYTGANVYKGMVGLMPIYDPYLGMDANKVPIGGLDPGDENDTSNPASPRLPGVKTINKDAAGNPDGTFDVEYDIPLALYDCRLDDGMTPHKDFHNGSGETRPEWWGKTFFRHFPNHGFVGDIFTVNGTAYPVMHVKRRKYRLRFLDASISRIYELKLMKGTPKAAKDMGYTGDELQGQWRLQNAQQCMKMYECANEGGLLPRLIERDSFELWPAKRREVVVDFTKHMDGSATSAGEEIYLVNTMKMTTGRMWDSVDPKYAVPLMKIVITDDAPDNSLPGVDLSRPDHRAMVKLRQVPTLWDGAAAAVNDRSIPTFELQRGSSSLSPETEWLINGLAFDPEKPLARPYQTPEGGAGEVWRIRNGGGGWVHPFHLHMEEHQVLQRNGKAAPDKRHPDDTGKEDVIALDPSEEVVIARRFRTFTGPYVAHCHNLAHEDHNMMYGWEIRPPAA
jgi:FtsP/CotA-like multicopper oxidase with cupredoxin domain